MTDYGSVRRVLATRLAKFLAAAIIVLGISPLTAPFATFDAAEIAWARVLHAGDAQLKVVQDTTDVTFITISTSPLTLHLALDSARLTDRTDIRPIRILVLRI